MQNLIYLFCLPYTKVVIRVGNTLSEQVKNRKNTYFDKKN